MLTPPMHLSDGPRGMTAPRPTRPGLWIAVVGVGLCALAAALYVAVRAYRGEAAMFHGQRRAVPLDAAARAISGVAAVSFDARDRTRIRGWYAPGRVPAAVVLAHGTGSDRRAVLADGDLLARAGLGVLVFDFPGHGESEGEVHWADGERAALVGALDFLAARPELAGAPLGVVGVSLGGVVAAQVAADDERVAALALVSTPSDMRALIAHEYRTWGALAVRPALLALQRNGMVLDDAQVLRYVPKLGARALLVVQGSKDGLVTDTQARDIVAAAGDRGELLLIEGAGHADFASVTPERYGARLAEFFSRSLGVNLP